MGTSSWARQQRQPTLRSWACSLRWGQPCWGWRRRSSRGRRAWRTPPLASCTRCRWDGNTGCGGHAACVRQLAAGVPLNAWRAAIHVPCRHSHAVPGNSRDAVLSSPAGHQADHGPHVQGAVRSDGLATGGHGCAGKPLVGRGMSLLLLPLVHALLWFPNMRPTVRCPGTARPTDQQPAGVAVSWAGSPLPPAHQRHRGRRTPGRYTAAGVPLAGGSAPAAPPEAGAGGDLGVGRPCARGGALCTHSTPAWQCTGRAGWFAGPGTAGHDSYRPPQHSLGSEGAPACHASRTPRPRTQEQ